MQRPALSGIVYTSVTYFRLAAVAILLFDYDIIGGQNQKQSALTESNANT